MAEKPILMNNFSTKAILSGRKTMTRRLVKFGKHTGEHYIVDQERFENALKHGVFMFSCDCIECRRDNTHMACLKAPYQVGDRLWVKESYRVDEKYNHLKPSELYGNFVVRYESDKERLKFTYEISDLADWVKLSTDFSPGRLRPSIFMPKKIARIWLEVTEVRAERLQDITEQDAKAEGVWWDGDYWRGGIHPIKKTLQCWNTAREAFKALWNSIHGKDAWETNPWVWVYGFKRLERVRCK